MKINGEEIIPVGVQQEKVQNHAPPGSMKEVRQFLGCIGWFRNYIEKYAEKTFYLTNSLRVNDNKQWIWTKEMENEFTQLK